MFLSFLGRFLVFVYILKTDFKLLKFYKKLNNKSKKSLTILYLFNRNYFICQFENIIFWLSSLEFKEKYQNHHYPPLLNPKKINYEKINAKLAWDLNLPLLKTKFFIYGSHGCGATGFGTFFKKCGITIITTALGDSGIGNYVYYYNYFLYFKDENPCFWFREYTSKKLANKFYSLLPEIDEALCLVRDPIDNLISVLSHRTFGKNYKNEICINDDIEIFLKNRVGYRKKEFIDKKSFIQEDVYKGTYILFHDALLHKRLNIKKVYFLDMSEIIGENAFKTMENLALKFDFKVLGDKEFYSKKVSDFNVLLPVNINLKNFFKKDIFITLKTSTRAIFSNLEEKEISNLFFEKETMPFCVFAKESDCEEILKLKKEENLKIHSFLMKFSKLLEKKEKEENQKKPNAEEILKYFLENKKLAKDFKDILEKNHLFYVKKERPDIVNLWENYKKFEKLIK